MRIAAALLALLVPTLASAQFETTEVSDTGNPPLLMTKAGWQWEDFSSAAPEVTYTVHRKMPGDEFRCIATNLPRESWTGDVDEPPSGQAFWYSITADDNWGENDHGSLVPVVERCPCGGRPPVTGPITRLDLELVARANRPVELVYAPGDTSRLFVVEQNGTIRIIRRGALLATPFLTVPGVVCCGEQGLLGMAFHPDYASNGRFFVYFIRASTTSDPPPPCGSRSGVTVVAEYRVSTDPDLADPAPVATIFELVQPYTNHNGGQIAFNPLDGFLYIGLGDGGSGNDPCDSGQRLDLLLGKILRIDIDGAMPYAIPPSNPFIGVGGAQPEIWAYGLRNPWRFNFDDLTGDLYIGDVGQNTTEEIDVGLFADGGGENYGWKIMEGDTCRGSTTQVCSSCATMTQCASFTPPVVNIVQTSTNPRSRSITGGRVYRGCRMPDMHGRYFFADYASDIVWSFELMGGVATNLIDWTAMSQLTQISGPSGFGVDGRGEIYFLGIGGNIYRLIPN